VLKVKLSRLIAVTAACLLLCGLISSQVFSQGGTPLRQPLAPQAGGGTNIALLDVSYIFKNHPRFKSMMYEMKADVDGAESKVTKERDTIRKLVEQLDSYHKGSPDYNAMEKEIAQKQADLTVQVQLQRNEFLAREAKIYFTVYKEIEQEVDYYCQNKGIDLVLRFNGDPADVDKPDSVLSFINKPVVYYDKSRDITKPILDTLVMRSGAPAGGGRIGTRPAGASNPFQNAPR
jgi:Skp family chaperone for outer membrane proteins